MTLASFRSDPRPGHLDRCKRFVSYIAKFTHATIRIKTEGLDLSSMPTTLCDCEELVYGKIKELTHHGATAPLGKYVVPISYHNANLFHNVITEQ